jgi:hypothetical protein
MKGDEDVAGPIVLKTSVAVFLKIEAPDMLMRDYFAASRAYHRYTLDLTKHIIATIAQADPVVDLQHIGEEYFVNRPRLYGNAITSARTESYKKIFAGDIRAHSTIESVQWSTFQLCCVGSSRKELSFLLVFPVWFVVASYISWTFNVQELPLLKMS